MEVYIYGVIKPKLVECSRCEATLKIVPTDLHTKVDGDVYEDFVDCPVCGQEVLVEEVW